MPLGSTGTGTSVVLAAILVGKPLGITLSSMAVIATGLRLPPGVRPRDLLVVGLTAAIGSTVALFFATAAFPGDAALQETKLGALFSPSAAALAPATAWGDTAGRFSARPRADAPDADDATMS